jgi:hypothetical protein
MWVVPTATLEELGADSLAAAEIIADVEIRTGRRDEGRWCVDPASVELQRLSRASWWRRVDMPKGKAEGLQQAATKRLIKAASA